MTLDIIFNGIQEEMPGYPEQWVFTDLLTGSTFYTEVGISSERLSAKTARIREKFSVSARKRIAGSEPAGKR